MARPKKADFADLDSDEQDMIASLRGNDLVAYVAKVAMDQHALMKAKEEDQDLAEKKEAAQDAGAQYRDGTKFNKLRISFAKRVLDDRTGDFVAGIKNARESRAVTNEDDRN